MVKKFSLVFNNNIVKSNLDNEVFHVLDSPGVKSACCFYGQFLAYIAGLKCESVSVLIPSGLEDTHGRAVGLFEVDEFYGRLLQNAIDACSRMSAEIKLVSIGRIAINLLFYKSGKKMWYARFQIDFSIVSGLYLDMWAFDNANQKLSSE